MNRQHSTSTEDSGHCDKNHRHITTINQMGPILLPSPVSVLVSNVLKLGYYQHILITMEEWTCLQLLCQ